MEWQSKREEDVEPVDGIEESQRDPGTGISVSVFHSQSGSGVRRWGRGGGLQLGDGGRMAEEIWAIARVTEFRKMSYSRKAIHSEIILFTAALFYRSQTIM